MRRGQKLTIYTQDGKTTCLLRTTYINCNSTFQPSGHLKFLLLIAICYFFFAFSTVYAQDLFVSSFGTDQILRYDGRTGNFIEIFASEGGLRNPQGLTFGPDGNLYVASRGSHQILRYDGRTGDFIDVFASGGELEYPMDITFGPDGNLYVTSYWHTTVLRYDGRTGDFIDIFTRGGSDFSIWPGKTFYGLTFGPNGNLYVSTYRNDVLSYNGNTGMQIGRFAGSTFLNPLPIYINLDVFGFVFGPDGYFYLAIFSQIVRFAETSRPATPDGSTGDFIDVFASGGGLSYPTDIVFGPYGNLYVASSGTDQILRYNGRMGEFIDVFASGGGLDDPRGLVFRRFALPQLPPTPTPTPIPWSSQKCQAGSLTLPITTIPPVCQCLKDGSARELRCGLLNPDFLLVFRTPIPILPGKPFKLSWTLIPLTKLPGDVYVNTVLPQDFKLKDQKSSVIKLSSAGDVDQASEAKLVFLPPKKPGQYPLRSRIRLTDQQWKTVLDQTLEFELPIIE